MRNILILPDGTELTSGTAGENGIFALTLTQCVNDGEELSIGSVCTNSIDVTVFNARGNLSLDAGSEVTLLREDGGQRTQVGVFTLEKPSRPSQNKLRLTGYDRIRRLDKDLSAWLTALTGWPYTAGTLAQMVCTECGLTLTEGEWPNKDYAIQKFAAGSITGRKLMQWLGQIFGSFCYATEQGEIAYGWYRQTDITLAPGGDQFYYQSSLKYDDFTVQPVDRVQIQLTEDDIGAYYPQNATGDNTYRVTGNYLLTATSADALLPVAQALYTRLSAVSYTPATVSAPVSCGVRVGDIVAVEDSNGNTIAMYVMQRTVTGHRVKLQCTGSRDRSKDVPASDPRYWALNAKMTEVKADMEGIRTTVSHVQEQKMYRLIITSSNGSIFKNGEIATTLSARVYSWDQDITDTLDPNQFIWTRVSDDAEADKIWNDAHYGGTKSVDITTADVQVRATFFCDLIDTTTRRSLL